MLNAYSESSATSSHTSRGLLIIMAANTGGCGKFLFDLVHYSPQLIHERPAENVGAARRKIREGFADLKDMLFVGDQAEGAAQTRLQAGMRVADRLQPSVAARE